MSTDGTTAGWYGDPGGSGGLRWWDGRQWTEHTQPPASPSSDVISAPVQTESGPTGFATQQPGWGADQPDRGGQTPGWGGQPGWGTQQPGAGGQQPGFGDHTGFGGQPGLGEQPGWGAQQPGAGGRQPGFGGLRRGWGGQQQGPGGMPPRTLWAANRYAFISVIVSLVYLVLAISTHFVLIGILPLLMSMRSMRARERFAPVALGLAIVVLVVGIGVLAH